MEGRFRHIGRYGLDLEGKSRPQRVSQQAIRGAQMPLAFLAHTVKYGLSIATLPDLVLTEPIRLMAKSVVCELDSDRLSARTC